jgi:hypothetical protein
MLEEMGETGTARRIVAATDFIEDVYRSDGAIGVVVEYHG